MDKNQSDTKSQAIRPNFYGEFTSLQSLKKIEVKEKNKADPEDQALYVLANTEGWKIMEIYIDNIIAELNKSVLEFIATGADFKEIGQRAVIKELTTNVLEKIKEKVACAREAGERNS